jgi:hypothetical protein
MRIRTVKPEYWQHEMHASLSESAALVALALLNYADDEGRFRANERTISSLLFTHRALSKPLEQCLAELEAIGWLMIYTVTMEGRQARVGQIVNFEKHQSINKPRRSSYPPPPRNTPGAVRECSRPEEWNATGEVPGEGKEGRERKGKEGAARARLNSVPTLEEVLEIAASLSAGLPESEKIDPDYAANYWRKKQEQPNTWWQRNGDQLIDVPQQLFNWWQDDRADWRAKKLKKTGGRNGHDVHDLQTALQNEPDAEKRRELRELIRQQEGA